MPTSLETEELDCTWTLLFPIFFLAGEVWKDISVYNLQTRCARADKGRCMLFCQYILIIAFMIFGGS